jgi:hypothetical protein
MGSGVLYSIAVRGKEWPFRKAVLECWQALSARDKTTLWLLESHVSGESARAARVVHAVCAAAVRRMTKADRKFWNASINRHVGHHAGWLPLMRRLGIIKAMRIKAMRKSSHAKGRGRKQGGVCTRSSEVLPRSSKVLHFSGNIKPYQIVPFDHKKHTSRLRTIAKVMYRLRSQQVPRTVGEWVRMMFDLRQELKQIPGGRDVANEDSYTFLWFARAHFLGEVSMWPAQRVLKRSTSLKLSEFSKGFPDQCAWISTLGSYFQAKTLPKLISNLRYKRPAELLCMDTCVFGDKGLQKYSIDDLKRLAPRIKRKRKELEKANDGLEPHPVVTMREACEGDEILKERCRLKRRKVQKK